MSHTILINKISLMWAIFTRENSIVDQHHNFHKFKSIDHLLTMTASYPLGTRNFENNLPYSVV